MRLDKFICKSTRLTKQQALQQLGNRSVTVNEVTIYDPAFQVHENNNVTLNGNKLIPRPFRYLLMNKPTQTICSNIDEVYPSALNLLTESRQISGASSMSDSINLTGSSYIAEAKKKTGKPSADSHLARTNEELKVVKLNTSELQIAESDTDQLNIAELHIAGRLDADTTGLILITDDGRWTYNITLPNNNCPKVYRVGLTRPIKEVLQDDLIATFLKGIQLQGESKLTLPAILEIINTTEVRLTITEGKFHQVKRMFSAVGNRLHTLHREEIGEVKLDVQEGYWRWLTPAEIDSFNITKAL